eukprot:SAG11_NODE_1001_length_6220_cov_6.550400_11_plen_71_part_00
MTLFVFALLADFVKDPDEHEKRSREPAPDRHGKPANVAGRGGGAAASATTGGTSVNLRHHAGACLMSNHA